MNTQTQPTRVEQRVAEAAQLYPLPHQGEGSLIWRAFGLAVLAHVIVLMINFPEFKEVIQSQQRQNVIVLRRYIPPPPPRREPRSATTHKKHTHKVPLPDPTPDEPEPIREPEPELPPVELPLNAEILIGIPEAAPGPPAPPGPFIAGSGGVTNPVRLEQYYVRPEYPEIARTARVQGNVVLQAVINCAGCVESVKVLRCNQPCMGFEESATDAVRQWRYEPATQGGRPVAVYFTVYVEFTLRPGGNSRGRPVLAF